MGESKLERDLASQLTLMGMDERWPFPPPEREYRFHDTRRWRFDMAWPALKVAVECEGLTFFGGPGRHQTKRGAEGDIEKYNTAQTMGWVIVRCSQLSITSGQALSWIESALKAATA